MTDWSTDLHTGRLECVTTGAPGDILNPDALLGGLPMTWKTPKIVEIALGAEINCYACAELSN